jgi:digeranylgeranylglycerophospholipid reductase
VHDVLVIGGGPAGSRAAYKLAGMGYDVRVIERKPVLDGPVCCTGLLSQRCVDTFAIKPEIIIRRANSARLFSPSGTMIRISRPENQVCIVDRASLNGWFAHQAQGQGAAYLLGLSVTVIEVMPDRVVVQARSSAGETLTLESRALVLASGFGSRLPEKVGLGKLDDFVMGAQAEVELPSIDEVEVYFAQRVAPGFFAWLVPTTGSKGLVGLLVRRHSASYMDKLILSLKQEGKIRSAGPASYRGIPLRPLSRTYGDRVLVIGDSAGQVKPTTGGGMYYGLMAADMAADTLGQALRLNQLTARNLSSYEKNWKKQLERELKICYYARKYYEHLNDRQIAHMFDVAREHHLVDDMVQAKNFSADYHGEVVLKLIRHRLMSHGIDIIMSPFRLGKSKKPEQALPG